MSKRTLLLPPYLDNNEVWTAYTNAIDSVWEDEVDTPTKMLKLLRNTYVVPTATETKIEAGELLDETDFDVFEKEILIKQVNMLGLILTNTDIMTELDYQRLFRNIGKFWYGKGKQDFIDFIGYCLNAIFDIVSLWTEDYVSFYEEGDDAIGTPVWESGTWYPTTHVRVTYDAAKFADVPINTFIALFYEFANYNLVL